MNQSKQQKQTTPTYSFAAYISADNEQRKNMYRAYQQSKNIKKMSKKIIDLAQMAKNSQIDYTLCGKQDLQSLFLKEMNLTSWNELSQTKETIYQYASRNQNVLNKVETLFKRFGIPKNRYENQLANQDVIDSINCTIKLLEEFKNQIDDFLSVLKSLTVNEVKSLNSDAAKNLNEAIAQLCGTQQIFLSTEAKTILTQSRNQLIQRDQENVAISSVVNDYKRLLDSTIKEFVGNVQKIHITKDFGIHADKLQADQLFKLQDLVLDLPAQATPDKELLKKLYGNQYINETEGAKLTYLITQFKVDWEIFGKVCAYHNLNDSQVSRLMQLIKQLNFNLFLAKAKLRIMLTLNDASSVDIEVIKEEINYVSSLLNPVTENYRKLAAWIKQTESNKNLLKGCTSEYNKELSAKVTNVRLAMNETIQVASQDRVNTSDFYTETNLLTPDEAGIKKADTKKTSFDSLMVSGNKWNVFTYSLMIFGLIILILGVFTTTLVGMNLFDVFILFTIVYTASLVASAWLGGK